MATMTRYSGSMGVAPLSETIDQLFRDAFTWPRLLNTWTDSRASRPYGFGLNSNLYETDDSYIMQVLLPGVKLDDLQITAHQNVVTLQGVMGVAAPEGARGIWVGLGGGQFHEQATLPGEVDADHATADYQDGILTITLPKAEHARVKTIKVGGSGKHNAIEGETK